MLSETETRLITMSDVAVAQLRTLLQQQDDPDLGLRVFVYPGGCSGMSYEMFFDSEKAADDITQSYGDVQVVVDAASAQHLNGASLDYKDGLQGAGFTINNPNAQRTCGCGQSFS